MEDEVLPHAIRTTVTGASRREKLVNDLYETTSYDNLPENFMELTEAGSDDDDRDVSGISMPPAGPSGKAGAGESWRSRRK